MFLVGFNLPWEPNLTVSFDRLLDPCLIPSIPESLCLSWVVGCALMLPGVLRDGVQFHILYWEAWEEKTESCTVHPVAVPCARERVRRITSSNHKM